MPRPRRPPRAGALTDLPPLKILTQICILQAAYYASATVLILFTALVAGKSFDLDLVLSWRSLRGDNTVGWMLGLVWMLNSLITVIFLLLLVARSKFILDFALTIHLINLIVTSLYAHSLPTNWLWWALQAASASLMTFLGVWSCQWRELRPINFGGSINTGEGQGQNNEEVGPSGEGEDGVDYSRGRGRGRGRDGGGEYEMVGLKGGDDANV